MKYFWSIIAAIIIIGGAWYVFSMDKGTEGAADMTVPAGTTGGDASSSQPSDTATAPTGTTGGIPAGTGIGVGVGVGATVPAVKEFVVEGSNFAFAPKELRVAEGTKVRIVFKNTGGTHDLVLDAFNVRTKILQGGASETIEFVANKKGTFEYYCSIGTHRQMGMRGNLIVE